MAAAVICSLLFLQAADLSTFVNRRYSYTIDYPRSWHLQVVADRFAIESFLPSDAPRGSRLAEGGAAIIVIVPEEIAQAGSDAPGSLDAWAKMGSKREQVTSTRNVEIETSVGPTPAIEIRTKCCADPPFEEDVEWYFRINNRYFNANLIHWENDPNMQAREETLKRVVVSLRVVRPQRNGQGGTNQKFRWQ